VTGHPTRSPIRVLLVDDHWVVRDGIALVISREPDMTVSAAVGSGEEGIAAFLRARPDVVLMDLQLGGMSGIEAIREIRKHDQDVPIVVLTMFTGEEDVHRALLAGATAYTLKGAPPTELVRVVRDVHAGKRVMGNEAQARLDDRAERPALTQREIDVLRLIFKGQRNKEISDTLSISEATVEAHLKNIFKKLDVHDRTAAVYVGLRRGILHVD
jgi:two-component system NarL family response regulator